jgi:hypothetical protein
MENLQNTHIKCTRKELIPNVKIDFTFFDTNKSTFKLILYNHWMIHLKWKPTLQYKSYNKAKIFSLQVEKKNQWYSHLVLQTFKLFFCCSSQLLNV